jgi:hypothetical protein
MMKLVKPKWPSAKQVRPNARYFAKKGGSDKKPTWTSLVLDVLVRADDFMSTAQVMAATGANIDQTTAALHHLSKCKAVESVVGGDGNLWWFATPDHDCRLRTVEERARLRSQAPGAVVRLALVLAQRVENSCLQGRGFDL